MFNKLYGFIFTLVWRNKPTCRKISFRSTALQLNGCRSKCHEQADVSKTRVCVGEEWTSLMESQNGMEMILSGSLKETFTVDAKDDSSLEAAVLIKPRPQTLSPTKLNPCDWSSLTLILNFLLVRPDFWVTFTALFSLLLFFPPCFSSFLISSYLHKP